MPRPLEALANARIHDLRCRQSSDRSSMSLPLKIATINTQGLGIDQVGVRKQTKLKRIFERAETSPQIILLQEHWLKEVYCTQKTRALPFKDGRQLWNPAVVSESGSRYRAGTAILISSQISHLLLEDGILLAGRLQYAILQWTTTSKLAVVNVYAHTDSTDRQQPWRILSEADLDADLYLLVGDFNMVESAE